MQLKNLFIFLMAVALALPLATAFNCTALDGEEQDVCNYIEDTNWPQEEKDEAIQNMIDSGDASLDGDFISIFGNEFEDVVELNTQEVVGLQISEENKEFLLDFSSISFFGYLIFSFLKNYFFSRFS
jgi:hypothetical protein